MKLSNVIIRDMLGERTLAGVAIGRHGCPDSRCLRKGRVEDDREVELWGYGGRGR